MDDVLGDSAFEGDSGTLASSLLSVCFLSHEAKALVCHVTCVDLLSHHEPKDKEPLDCGLGLPNLSSSEANTE